MSFSNKKEHPSHYDSDVPTLLLLKLSAYNISIVFLFIICIITISSADTVDPNLSNGSILSKKLNCRNDINVIILRAKKTIGKYISQEELTNSKYSYFVFVFVSVK